MRGRERDLAEGIWRDALDASYTGPPVWFHGDVAMSNLLTNKPPGQAEFARHVPDELLTEARQTIG